MTTNEKKQLIISTYLFHHTHKNTSLSEMWDLVQSLNNELDDLIQTKKEGPTFSFN